MCCWLLVVRKSLGLVELSQWSIGNGQWGGFFAAAEPVGVDEWLFCWCLV
jgi:hypothetical protein